MTLQLERVVNGTTTGPSPIPTAAPGRNPRRRARVPLVLAALTLALLVLTLAALAFGPVTVPLADTVRVLVGATPTDPRWRVVIETLRAPRVVTAMLVGAALGVAGLQLQTLFRNALADPYVLGVSSGGSLGVAMVVITGTGGPPRISPPGWLDSAGSEWCSRRPWGPLWCWGWCCCWRGGSAQR